MAPANWLGYETVKGSKSRGGTAAVLEVQTGTEDHSDEQEWETELDSDIIDALDMRRPAKQMFKALVKNFKTKQGKRGKGGNGGK